LTPPRSVVAQACLECLEDIWDRDGGEGFFELSFDPRTQLRSNVLVNNRTADIGGMHKEEARPPIYHLCLRASVGDCCA
jgi:hypothetical protein